MVDATRALIRCTISRDQLGSGQAMTYYIKNSNLIMYQWQYIALALTIMVHVILSCQVLSYHWATRRLPTPFGAP